MFRQILLALVVVLAIFYPALVSAAGLLDDIKKGIQGAGTSKNSSGAAAMLSNDDISAAPRLGNWRRSFAKIV